MDGIYNVRSYSDILMRWLLNQFTVLGIRVQGIDADGAPVTVDPVVVGGVDGSGNVQQVLTDTEGRIESRVQGLLVDGVANTSDAVIMGAKGASGNVRTLQSGETSASATVYGYLNVLPKLLYRLTTPNLTDLQAALALLNRDGSLRVNADCYDFIPQTQISAAGAFTRMIPTYPFDGFWISQDTSIVYMQPRGRPWPIVDGTTFTDPTKWGGTNWAVAGAKATHTTGSTAALTTTLEGSRPIKNGRPYAVVMSIVKRAGTSITPYIGAVAGTAIAGGTGSYICVIQAGADNAAVTAVPTSDWDGDVTFFEYYTASPVCPAKSYCGFASAEIVGIALASAPTTLVAYATGTNSVFGLYRRVPGVTELG